MSLLLGRNWQKALQVVDQNEVECYIGENSRRHVFQVCGISSTPSARSLTAHCLALFITDAAAAAVIPWRQICIIGCVFDP
jgi:hypothetical protein